MLANYPKQKGYLRVSEIHEIYYEVCAADDAKPYLFVDVGPGAGFTEQHKRFFDFKKHKLSFLTKEDILEVNLLVV